MGLRDRVSKLMGNAPAASGVEPIGVEELRSVLLGLNRESAPWQVRDGAEEKCDLLAEWRIVDARWSGVFFDYGLQKVYRTRLRFDEDHHEVRHVDQETSLEWRDGVPQIGRMWSSGQLDEVEYGRGIAFTEEGALGEVYDYRFRSSEIKDPLRDAVVAHGWGWKAASFRL
jgi:hypothetical protein